ncbi:MAG: hypothetical protein K2Q18_05745 [Bdellovibrionales bacterium]|nr:hypothetical protein [Bdellovibrionales bacterium]
MCRSDSPHIQEKFLENKKLQYEYKSLQYSKKSHIQSECSQVCEVVKVNVLAFFDGIRSDLSSNKIAIEQTCLAGSTGVNGSHLKKENVTSPASESMSSQTSKK